MCKLTEEPSPRTCSLSDLWFSTPTKPVKHASAVHWCFLRSFPLFCFEPSYLSHITKRLQLKVEIKYGLVWAVNLKRFFCKKVKTFHWGSQVLLTVQKPVWVTRCQFCSSNHLEKSLQLLMDRVDDMSQDIVKYNTYSRNLSKQQQQKHQVTLECMNAPWHTHTETDAPTATVSAGKQQVDFCQTWAQPIAAIITAGKQQKHQVSNTPPHTHM